MSKRIVENAVSVLRIGSTDRLGRSRRVREALRKTKGVNEVILDYVNGTVTVKYDPDKVDTSTLRNVIRETEE
jgi:allophanate hydrolase subunit 1